VHFREPSAWERYRWQLTGIFLALLLQSSMITWLLLERYGRRRAEAQSRTLTLQVMHLNRAAEAGALSASFAHDLGQPLVAIALNAERASQLLNSDQQDLGKIRKAVLDIMHGTDHASQIIKSFRTLLRRRSGGIQGADLAAVIADASSILGPEAAKRQIVLHRECHEGPLMVRADPVHLLQILLNLATNAMDALADVPANARRVTIRSEVLEDSTVEVTVADTGPGIPADKIDEIFDTFYTTKENGTGLGLSIARTIVETYGGRIWAENRKEGGAALHFTLPVTATA
jgi:signal transduction histidine kinase